MPPSGPPPVGGFPRFVSVLVFVLIFGFSIFDFRNIFIGKHILSSHNQSSENLSTGNLWSDILSPDNLSSDNLSTDKLSSENLSTDNLSTVNPRPAHLSNFPTVRPTAPRVVQSCE